MTDDVRERVIRVVAETLKTDPSQITAESRFIEELGASSMQSVELIAAFEEEFDVDLDEERAFGVKTIAHAVEFITACVG